MTNPLGPSWRTTVSGIVTAASAFVLFGAQSFHIAFPQWVLALATFTTMGGLAGLGFAAKDSQVTGGSIVQAGIPVAPVPPEPVVGPVPVAQQPAPVLHPPASSAIPKPQTPSKW